MFGSNCFCDKRLLMVFSKCCKNYYDVLGIPPKSTQADIKAAYYKLSMVYHPDRNQGSKVASDKFQDITSAYEVLGNYKSRRLYDKGIVIGDTVVGDVNNEAVAGIRKSTVQSKRPFASFGRTPIYNYDEWSRIHYGEAFNRKSEAKTYYNVNVKNKADLDNIKTKETFTFVFVTIVLLLCIFTATLSNDLDSIEPKTKNPLENDKKKSN